MSKKRRGAAPGVVAVFGDDEFLRRTARKAVKEWILGTEPNAEEFALTVFSAEQPPTAPVVFDELRTAPFVGDRRLVVVEAADKFVTEHRGRLEKLAGAPSSVGVLLLDVRTWLGTTNLAKKTELAVDCNAPKQYLVAGWLAKWAPLRHGKKLDPDDAALLVEFVGADLGTLDQELGKLATFVGAEPAIGRAAILELAAGGGADSIFKMIDAALDGAAPQALKLLDKLLSTGDDPRAAFGAATASLRKFAEAARRAGAGGQALDAALRDAGVPPFAVIDAGRRLRRIGRGRLAGLYRRLLRTDWELKGGSALPARTVIERLLLGIAR